MRTNRRCCYHKNDIIILILDTKKVSNCSLLVNTKLFDSFCTFFNSFWTKWFYLHSEDVLCLIKYETIDEQKWNTANLIKTKNRFKTLFKSVLKRFERELVGGIGFEPTTSALSRRRSKPTELTALFHTANICLKIKNYNVLMVNYVNFFRWNPI